MESRTREFRKSVAFIMQMNSEEIHNSFSSLSVRNLSNSKCSVCPKLAHTDSPNENVKFEFGFTDVYGRSPLIIAMRCEVMNPIEYNQSVV